jgi:hypothetical protein
VSSASRRLERATLHALAYEAPQLWQLCEASPPPRRVRCASTAATAATAAAAAACCTAPRAALSPSLYASALRARRPQVPHPAPCPSSRATSLCYLVSPGPLAQSALELPWGAVACWPLIPPFVCCTRLDKENALRCGMSGPRHTRQTIQAALSYGPGLRRSIWGGTESTESSCSQHPCIPTPALRSIEVAPYLAPYLAPPCMLCYVLGVCGDLVAVVDKPPTLVKVAQCMPGPLVHSV